MPRIVKIHYAYPSSPIGGREGGYFFDQRYFKNENEAVFAALKTLRPVLIDYGSRERADRWREHGVKHSLDPIT